MVTHENREFDIIIFGATGYAGQYVIEELAHSSVSNNLKWAIAGRSTERMKKSLSIVQGYLGETMNIQGVTVIEADAKNATSLNKMCKRAKLILNCMGPYKLYCELVVQACIQNGTHHVDITGDMTVSETIHVKYFDEARAKKIYIVGSCGSSSLIADYGTSLLKQNFNGDLNSVEFYFEYREGPSGMSYIGKNILSEMAGFTKLFEQKFDKLLKDKMFKKDPPKNKYALSQRMPLFYSKDVKGWFIRNFVPDDRVIRRSEMFRYEYLNERPVQSRGYHKNPSFLYALVTLVLTGIMRFIYTFSFGRYLVDEYPEFFSAGGVGTIEPTRQQVMEASMITTFIGEGWKDKLLDPNDQHNTKPDTKLKLIITGPEPGYVVTAICMVQSGITILEETNNMPLEGGVLTPGVAFDRTSLRRRLENRGITFRFEAC